MSRYIDELLGGLSPTGVNVAAPRKKNPWGQISFHPPEQEEKRDETGEDWASFSQRRNRSTTDEFDSSDIMNRYLKHIGEAPNRDDYSPSIWRRIVAGIGGGAAGGSGNPLAGIKAAEEINETPYRRAVEDYNLKGQGLETAARIEQGTNKQRLDYLSELNKQDKADKDRELKRIDSDTRRTLAQLAERRIELQEKIATSTNDLDKKKYELELRDFERSGANELRRLSNQERALDISQQQANTNSRRADDYGRAVTAQGSGGMMPTQLKAARDVAAEQVANRHRTATTYEPAMMVDPSDPTGVRKIPDPRVRSGKGEEEAWIDPVTGQVKPQFAEQFEREIQEELARSYGNRGYGRIQLGAGRPQSFIPPPEEDNPYERIP